MDKKRHRCFFIHFQWVGMDMMILNSPFLSANLLVRQGRYIWFRLMRRDALMERREHRTHRQLDWAQNKSSGCVALPHVTLPPHTQLSESHFSCCLIKPIMSYTTRLLKRHPRQTAPFWRPRGCHGSISIMSHGNRHPVICRRGSYAPKMLHNEKVQKPKNMRHRALTCTILHQLRLITRWKVMHVNTLNGVIYQVMVINGLRNL